MTGTGATTIATAAFNHTAGNPIVVGIRADPNGTLITSVVDTAGNKYYRLCRTASTGKPEMWWTRGDTGHATNVITVTFNGSASFRSVVCAEYGGFTGTAFIDILPSITGEFTVVSNTVTTPAFTTVIADELIVAVSQVDATGSTWTPDTGFSTAVQDASNVVYMQDRIVSAVQTNITVSATSSSGASKNIVAATFCDGEASGGGGGSPGGSPGDGATETGFATVGG